MTRNVTTGIALTLATIPGCSKEVAEAEPEFKAPNTPPALSVPLVPSSTAPTTTTSIVEPPSTTTTEPVTTTVQAPVEEIDRNESIIPHDSQIAGLALTGSGEHVLDNPETQVELIIDGGVDDDCVATVAVSVSEETEGPKEVHFSPGIATALEDLDAVSMNLSVHLDVDTGEYIPSPTIPASEISDETVMENAADELLNVARNGCEIWARDIAPTLGG